MLHGMERGGYLTSRKERLGRTFRRLYRATALGREANKIAKLRVRELVGEMVEGPRPARKKARRTKS
jgi:hypothetical protein